MNYETSITAEAADNIQTEASGITADKPLISRGVLIAGIVVIGLLLALAAYAVFSADDGAAAADDNSQAPVVTVVAPGQTTVEGLISAPGTIAARRELPVGVVGEGGRVVSVPVDAGDWVRQGQVLAVIDRSVQAQQAQAQAAQISVAQADANLAQANLDRALQLVERGFISKADVDRLTSTRDAANARVRVAQAQLGELRARNARLNIVAPAAGLVLARNVEPGQTVSGGTPALFSIARGGEMEMLAQVSEAQLASLGQGIQASVVPTGSEKSLTGQVWQISPTVDAQNRQGTARIALPYAQELRPGGFATAEIKSGTVVATVLPESAVLADRQGSYVYVVGDEKKAERRRVKTGMVTDSGIVITEGLSGNEQIVLRAGGFLTEGEVIAPKLLEES